jgi:FdhD protein
MTGVIIRARRRLVSRRKKGDSQGERAIPAEVPVALSYDSATYAVMMASPANLEDFALGFTLSEQIIETPSEIAELGVVEMPHGFELRMSLTRSRAAELESRRRRIAGPAGCGLCGIESLEAAIRPPRRVDAQLAVPRATIFTALRSLEKYQAVNAETHAVHAAGFWSMETNAYAAVREDVGRHNALDKLIGELARAGIDAAKGFIVMTSRVSIELVQKTAVVGCPMLVAVSAPTSFALEAAEVANITLVAVARNDSFEIFSHPERIIVADGHVA